jgi:hypothetical protein
MMDVVISPHSHSTIRSNHSASPMGGKSVVVQLSDPHSGHGDIASMPRLLGIALLSSVRLRARRMKKTPAYVFTHTGAVRASKPCRSARNGHFARRLQAAPYVDWESAPLQPSRRAGFD